MASVDDWSGGTRIGEAIETFNRRYARRVLSHGAPSIGLDSQHRHLEGTALRGRQRLQNFRIDVLKEVSETGKGERDAGCDYECLASLKGHWGGGCSVDWHG